MMRTAVTNTMLAIVLTSITCWAGQPPVRKAMVTCEFKNFADRNAKINTINNGKLIYKLDLDSDKVAVSCDKQQGTCLLDGYGPIQHELTTSIDKEASLAPVVFEAPHSGYTTNMPSINIEGSNGDDMEMFTRISFGAINTKEIEAIAVLVYAPDGNDGWVSVPTRCAVELGK